MDKGPGKILAAGQLDGRADPDRFKPKFRGEGKMRQTISDELGVPGHTVLYETKSKTLQEWIQQAKDAMTRAEQYGASTPNQMKQKEKDDLRDALNVLGQNPQF